jgi:elongation factor Ts
MVDIEVLKKLRIETGISIAQCREALEVTDGNIEKAKEWLKKQGLEKADKKADRETHSGLVESYIHQTGRTGCMLVILCETDFVARTEDFKHLAHEIAMQIVAMNPKDVDSLLKQEYIRDGSVTIQDLIKQTVAKLGENIVIKEFKKFEI